MSDVNKVEINPFTKTLWWSKEEKELWEPRISRIRKAYNTTEFLTVAKGLRRVYVYHVNSEKFEESYQFLRENNLMFYPTNKSGVYSGFSHKHMPVKRGEPFTLYGGVVKANDKEAGDLFTKYSVGGATDHGGIGSLLGYPDCCVNFFNAVWNKKSIDPIYEAAELTDGMKKENGVITVKTHPYCNNMLRYFGMRITPHLTCSLQCKKTVKWGKKWIEIMKEVDAEAAEWVEDLLSQPLTWDCYKGISIIETDLFRGVTNSDGVLYHKRVNSLGWKK